METIKAFCAEIGMIDTITFKEEKQLFNYIIAETEKQAQDYCDKLNIHNLRITCQITLSGLDVELFSLNFIKL
jgi:hypothetical protein